MEPTARGPRRVFDAQKQQDLVGHVAHGESVDHAAFCVGVTLRPVQRAAKVDRHFRRELELALQSAPVDPRHLMNLAARTHWRAAAWLLERTDPEHYSKRRPSSCSYEQLEKALSVVIDRALLAAPAEHRHAIYQRAEAAAERAMTALFPDHNQWGDRQMATLADAPTPLRDDQYYAPTFDPANFLPDYDEQGRPIMPGPAPAVLSAAGDPRESAIPHDDATPEAGPDAELVASAKVVDSSQGAPLADANDSTPAPEPTAAPELCRQKSSSAT